MNAVVAVADPLLTQEIHIGHETLGNDRYREDEPVRQIRPKGVERAGGRIRLGGPTQLMVMKTGDVQVQIQAAIVVFGDMLTGLPCFVNVREGRCEHGSRQGKG